MGISNEEESKWGDSVAYFKKAYELLQSIANPSQNSSEFLSKDQIKETTVFAHDVIKGKYDIAVRENEFIYHEKVPTDLEELKGKLLKIICNSHNQKPNLSFDNNTLGQKN